MVQKSLIIEKIPYAEGTFDTEIYKNIHDAILSSSITFVEIEGSIRAGKDVLSLNCYAEFLMLTPDKYHLCTHVTMDAAKKTVYDADGFGLKFLIPHGKLVSIDNRDVFRFTDWNGLEKEVHFFGLSQYNDHEKFRGMNYGSHYANEATRQNILGLKNARDRTTAAKWRKVIYTQNPISPSNPFYEEIEKPLIATDKECAEIYEIRERYKDEYKSIKNKYQIKENEIVKDTIKKYLEKQKKSSLEFLSNSEKLVLRKKVLVKKYENRQAREEEMYDKYGFTSKHFVFVEGGNNVNNIKNGLDFRYLHLTLDDNLAITKVRKEEVKASYDINSLHYKQDILGIRALTDGAIYDNLTNDLFYYIPLPDNLMKLGWSRVIAIDYGVINDFVILDSYIEPQSKCVFIENEFRFKGSDEKEQRNATNELYVKFVQDMINSHEGGKYTLLLYDPSARPFANTLASHNIKCQRANNTVKRSKRVKKLDLENQDQKLFKENSGIMLVKDGFGMKKILINKLKCKNLVEELEGYSFDPKKLKVGIEEPLKIKDHGCDALRYIVNTCIKTTSTWRNSKLEGVDIKNVEEKLSKITDTSERQPDFWKEEYSAPTTTRKNFCSF